ncbi:hypothetical protein MBCUR_07890 [Methanobrevibacter curvatus]|uniref:Uncharacterized protein n=1 Tax=Methanobrevibacter curvatus TaxID=49547 RepID=A0A166B777_9EURY|nr:hypothetical protein MBCUR_07890 [Methanobrevibacter curvatus]
MSSTIIQSHITWIIIHIQNNPIRRNNTSHIISIITPPIHVNINISSLSSVSPYSITHITRSKIIIEKPIIISSNPSCSIYCITLTTSRIINKTCTINSSLSTSTSCVNSKASTNKICSITVDISLINKQISSICTTIYTNSST